MTEPYKRANPLIWGAVAAIVAGAMMSISLLLGESAGTQPLLENPIWTAVGAFFWGWVAGNAKNWYGRRINRQ